MVSNKTLGSKFVASIALAFFGTSMLDVLASLFLIDITKTFFGFSNLATIGIVSQIVTISGIVAMTAGLLNAFFSVRISHKKLLLFGALCIAIGSLGCLLAPNLIVMQIFYPFDGIGTVLVASMAFTLIGESLPLERRARSVGWVTAAGIFSTGVGFAIAGYIATFGTWRTYLLWYSLPISIAALVIAYLLIPSRPYAPASTNVQTIKDSFKRVLGNKSATTCLVGHALMNAASMWSFFAATFWRKQFLLSVQEAAVITVVVVMVYAVGGVVGGRLVDRRGRKPLVVITWVVRGLLIIGIVFMPTFWSALFLSFVATLVGGFALTAGHTLNLEQASCARGTMMSLSATFGSLGSTIGVAVGGFALASTYGFQALGATLGALAVAAAILVSIMAKDPTTQC
jgi:MFS transporter, DHA2 family, methylenomycin A resistance protein